MACCRAEVVSLVGCEQGSLSLGEYEQSTFVSERRPAKLLCVLMRMYACMPLYADV